MSVDVRKRVWVCQWEVQFAKQLSFFISYTSTQVSQCFSNLRGVREKFGIMRCASVSQEGKHMSAQSRKVDCREHQTMETDTANSKNSYLASNHGFVLFASAGHPRSDVPTCMKSPFTFRPSCHLPV